MRLSERCGGGVEGACRPSRCNANIAGVRHGEMKVEGGGPGKFPGVTEDHEGYRRLDGRSQWLRRWRRQDMAKAIVRAPCLAPPTPTLRSSMRCVGKDFRDACPMGGRRSSRSMQAGQDLLCVKPDCTAVFNPLLEARRGNRHPHDHWDGQCVIACRTLAGHRCSRPRLDALQRSTAPSLLLSFSRYRTCRWSP